MDDVYAVAAALAGAAAGAVYGAAIGRWVSTRRAGWFWAAAVGAFVIGVGVAAAGTLLGARAAAWGGFAFAAVGASVLKWRSGRVPGVSVPPGAKG